MKMRSFTKKLALASVLTAVAVVGSTFSFPVFSSKCAPVQHMVNILCAVFLGPGFGVAAALLASSFWKVCSHRADNMAGERGSGSFRAALLDAACTLTGSELEREANHFSL